MMMYLCFFNNVYGVKESWPGHTRVAMLLRGENGISNGGLQSFSRGASCKMQFYSPKTVCAW